MLPTKYYLNHEGCKSFTTNSIVRNVLQNAARLIRRNGPIQRISPVLHPQLLHTGDAPASVRGFFSVGQGEESNHQEEEEDVKKMPQQLIGLFLDLFLMYVL